MHTCLLHLPISTHHPTSPPPPLPPRLTQLPWPSISPTFTFGCPSPCEGGAPLVGLPHISLGLRGCLRSACQVHGACVQGCFVVGYSAVHILAGFCTRFWKLRPGYA